MYEHNAAAGAGNVCVVSGLSAVFAPLALPIRAWLEREPVVVNGCAVQEDNIVCRASCAATCAWAAFVSRPAFFPADRNESLFWSVNNLDRESSGGKQQTTRACLRNLVVRALVW